MLRCGFLVMAVALSAVWCYPFGAPDDACETMVPQHGGKPQSSPCPFVTKPSAVEILSNGSLEVIIKAESSSDSFKGFLVMAFDNSSSELGIPIGTFKVEDGKAKVLDCSHSKNAATHVSGITKDAVTVVWSPPEDFNGTVVFRTTYVKSQKSYWTKQLSDAVRVKRASSATVTDSNSTSKDQESTTKKPSTSSNKPSVVTESPSSWTTTVPPETADAASSLGALAVISVVCIGITVAIMA